MIWSLFYFLEGAFFLGALAMYKANQKVDILTKRARKTKYIVYFIIVHLVVFSALAGTFYFLALMSLVVILGAFELWRAFSKNIFPSVSPIQKISVFILYLFLAGGLLIFSKQADSSTLLFVYLTVVNLDGFSQVTGQLIGKRKIFSKLSPNKTFEGFLGGTVAAVLTTMLFHSWMGFSLWSAFLVGLFLSVACLAGDLAASWCKRVNHLKDFGTLLPGHGGILDRFDSLLFAGPVFWGCHHYLEIF